MKIFFNRRTNHVDNKHAKSQSNSKSKTSDSNRTKETEITNSSPLEDALEKYFSEKMEKEEASPFISQGFTVIIRSKDSSVHELSSSKCSLEESNDVTGEIKGYQRSKSQIAEGFLSDKHLLRVVSREEALSKIAEELAKVRGQVKELQTLIDQRNLKVALCFQDKNPKRHQVIIEMQRLLQLESQRDCLVEGESELERLQMTMKEYFAGDDERFHQLMAHLSTISTRNNCNHSCTTTIATTGLQSSDEIYEEAQTRVQAWKLVNGTDSAACFRT